MAEASTATQKDTAGRILDYVKLMMMKELSEKQSCLWTGGNECGTERFILEFSS